MINLGWIKLYRELKSKSIWQLSTPQQKVVLITILMTVNHEENKWEWKGEQFICNPGQMITSLTSLVKECGPGVTIKNVRTAIERFEKLGFLTNESTKTGRLITVVNWEKYQGNEYDSGKDTGKQVAKIRQRGGKQVAPIKEYKNIRIKENKNTPPKSPKGEKECGENILLNLFWNAYPKKIAKGKVEKWFDQNKPSEQIVKVMVEKISLLKNTRQWQKEDGRYIPYPINWLNAKGWEDEIPANDVIESEEEEIARLEAEVKRRKESGEW